MKSENVNPTCKEPTPLTRFPQRKTPGAPHLPSSLIPHDIILTDIRAILALDDLERDAAGGSELVLRRLGDESPSRLPLTR